LLARICQPVARFAEPGLTQQEALESRSSNEVALLDGGVVARIAELQLAEIGQ
jgi:hypothetical protein